MTVKHKTWGLIAATLLLGVGSAFLTHSARRTAPDPTQALNWTKLAALLLGIASVASMVGAIILAVVKLMPRAFRAPDADELSEGQAPGPTEVKG